MDLYVVTVSTHQRIINAHGNDDFELKKCRTVGVFSTLSRARWGIVRHAGTEVMDWNDGFPAEDDNYLPVWRADYDKGDLNIEYEVTPFALDGGPIGEFSDADMAQAAATYKQLGPV